MCKIELKNFLEDNKLTNSVHNFNEKWELALGKQTQIKLFESKLTQYFQETIKIYLPKDVLRTYETPNALISFVGYTNLILKLQETDRNEIHFETNSFLYRSKIAGYQYVVNFIMNKIPSDIYRFKNPKMQLDSIQKSQNMQ